MQNRELKFIIRVQNEAKAALSRLRGQLGDVGKGGDQVSRSSKAAQRSQKELAQQAQRTTAQLKSQAGAVATLARGMKLLVGFFGIREAIGLADAYTNLTNKLKTLAGGPEEAARALDRLDGISTRTLGSLEATVSIYQRVTQSQEALGISSDTTYRFIENLNNAVRISGASAIEAKSGLLQLGQGLGSGVLQGQELNAVLESMPYVARLIADELGVKTPGALKKLASEGKVQSRQIIDAINNAQEEIQETAAKMAPTIGQSIQQMKDQLTLAFGELATSTGITSGLAVGIQFIAENMRDIVRVAKVALVTFAAFKASQGFGFLAGQIGRAKIALGGYVTAMRIAIRQQARLNAALSGGAASSGLFAKSLIGLRVAARAAGTAIMSIPLVGWALAAVAAVLALVELTSTMKVSKDSAATMGDVYGVAMKKISSEAKAGANSVVGYWSEVLGMDLEFDNVDFRGVILNAANMVDEIMGRIEQLTVFFPARTNQMAGEVAKDFVDIYNAVVNNWINPALAAVTGWANKVVALGAAVVGGIRGGLSALPDVVAAVFHNAMVAAALIVQSAVNDIGGMLNLLPGIDITPNVDLVGMVGSFKKVPSAAASAGAEAAAAYNANLNTFDASTVENMKLDAMWAARASGDAFNSSMEAAMARGRADSGVLTWWTDVFDEAEKQAGDAAFADAAKGEAITPVVAAAGEGSGKKGGKPKAAKDGIKSVKDAIADLMKELFPARDRMAEFAEKMALLSKVKMNPEDTAFAVRRLEEKYGLASDAIGVVTTDLQEQIQIMSLAGNASEDLAFRLDLERAAREDGPLDADTKARIDNAVAMNKQARAVEAMKNIREDFDRLMEDMAFDTSLLGVGMTDAEAARMRDVEGYRLDMLRDRGIAQKALIDMTPAEIAAYEEIARKVDAYAAAINRAEQAQRAQRADSMAGLREGIQQWSDNASDLYGQMSQLATQTLDGMATVLTDFVTTGKANFADFARFAIRSITQIIVKMLLLRAIQGIGNAIAPGLGTALTSVGTNHKGGMAGRGGGSTMVSPALFANAVRLHSGGMVPKSTMAGIGGLKQGEVPIVALETERVLNPEETAAYNAGLARSGASAAISAGGVATGGNPQQVVLAPTFHNDFSGLAKDNGVNEDQAVQAEKAFEAEAKIFMEKWVQRESQPGGRLAPRG